MSTVQVKKNIYGRSEQLDLPESAAGIIISLELLNWEIIIKRD